MVKPQMTGQYQENTFVLSMGKMGDDHRIIEEKIKSDFENF